MRHASGCPLFTVNEFVRAVDRNIWIAAILAIIIGTLVAFRGRSMFPVAASTLVFFTAAKTLMYASAELGYMADTTHMIMVIIGSILVGFVCGHIARKVIRIGVAFVGIMAGMALGALVFGIALSVSDGALSSTNDFLVFEAIFGVAGLIMAVTSPKAVVLTGTSIVGSFTAMHGWYLIFGGFPDEWDLAARLDSGETVRLGSSFYVYCAAFACLFFVSAFVQSRAEDNAETIDALGKGSESHVEMAE